MTEDQAAATLNALAQPLRLRMLRHLVRCGPAGSRAGDLAQAVEVAPSLASFHLNTLSQAGLIVAEKVSRSVVYRADFAALGSLVGYLVNDCCAADPRVAACCSPAAQPGG
ncbi:ArsR/SmtB family transcription factor [Pontivivens ytuae]|uniref:Helix-turn-helix transcriptional regulator n=1 Tax=Pontivivens ytuae TaxID=2789856 RepID=A0A7S9QBV1_9RHOB|nr:metalloregulator ArsR/SmtB family transcription factor [Pontivivens ytuae]QPH53273.1 helix-turn-helix transcriptional regulator [Pontivivens ytuae]